MAPFATMHPDDPEMVPAKVCACSVGCSRFTVADRVIAPSDEIGRIQGRCR